MASEYIKHILDIFRTHNILLYALCMASGFLSYDLLGVAELTGFSNLKLEYQKCTGVVFFASSILIFILVIQSIFVFFKKLYRTCSITRKIKKSVQFKIDNLSNKEKAILLQFFNQESDTILLPFNAPEVSELVNEHLIHHLIKGKQIAGVEFSILMKLPIQHKYLLINKYPQIFSQDRDENLVCRLTTEHLPLSVKRVVINQTKPMY